MKKLVPNRMLLYGNIAIFLYFLSLIAIFIFGLKITIVGVITEILTIPLSLFLVLISIYAVIELSKENFNLRSTVFFTLYYP